MKHNTVLPIARGAMIGAIYGVCSIINAYTGSAFDIGIAYIMVLPMIWYAQTYTWKYVICLYVTSAVIIFICGQLLFLVVSMPTLLLGIFCGWYQRRNGKHMFLGLLCISIIKNVFLFFVMGGLLGISVYTEGKEIYQEIVYWIPFLKNVINADVLFVLLWLLIFVSEAYCVMVYNERVVHRIIKKK